MCPTYKETGRVRALTLEEVDKYLRAAKGDMKDFAALALETGGRPMELLALHKNHCPSGGGLRKSAGHQERESQAGRPVDG